MKHKSKALKTIEPSAVEGLCVHSRVGQKGIVRTVAPTVGAENSYTVKIEWASGSVNYVHLEDCDQIFVDNK